MSDNVQIDCNGATWLGMRVAGWTWEDDTFSPDQVPRDNAVRCYADHWSTGPHTAERLYRESDVAALLSKLRAPVVGEYTSAMGEAAQSYLDSFPYAHKLPAQFRWSDLWTAMHNAAPRASDAVRDEDVATVLNFIFEHFGKPFNACDLPWHVVAAVRRMEHACLSIQPKDPPC